jgi:pimeloyl-ACP methyl ester carboxylesterase
MPVQTRYAQNDGVTVAYETFGDPAAGEPLLLITGLDFQMVWWPDAFCQQLAERGFAVVRFDNRDSGLSTKFDSAKQENPFLALLGRTRPSYTTLDMLEDAIAVMTAVGWTSAHIMGASMGAALAQAMAVCHPERVRTLICAAGVPADASGVRLMGYLRFGFFAKVRTLKPAATREQEISNLVEIFRAVTAPGYPFPEKWAREVAEVSHDRSPRDPRSTQRQLAAGRAQKIPPISGINVPTLVFCGRDDPLIKPRGSRDIAARIPGATMVIYPGMGHSLPEELWPDFVVRISALAGLTGLWPRSQDPGQGKSSRQSQRWAFGVVEGAAGLGDDAEQQPGRIAQHPPRVRLLDLLRVDHDRRHPAVVRHGASLRAARPGPACLPCGYEPARKADGLAPGAWPRTRAARGGAHPADVGGGHGTAVRPAGADPSPARRLADRRRTAAAREPGQEPRPADATAAGLNWRPHGVFGRSTRPATCSTSGAKERATRDDSFPYSLPSHDNRARRTW